MDLCLSLAVRLGVSSAEDMQGCAVGICVQRDFKLVSVTLSRAGVDGYEASYCKKNLC